VVAPCGGVVGAEILCDDLASSVKPLIG